MAGPQSIQRYPRGLIDLLGMRATGDTPQELAQSVIGNLELLEFYLADRLIPNASVGAAPMNAVGDFAIAGLTVPSREIWLVYEVTLTSGTTAAATAVTATAGLMRNVGSGNVYSALTMPSTAGAAAQLNVGSKFDRPVMALPGNVFNVRCSAVTGVPAATPTVAILYASIGV